MNRAQQQIGEAVSLIRLALIDRASNGQVADLGVLDERGAISDETARGLLLVINSMMQMQEVLNQVLFNACEQLAEATGNPAQRMGKPPMSQEEFLQMLAVSMQQLYSDESA